jgi:hypothetical protein
MLPLQVEQDGAIYNGGFDMPGGGQFSGEATMKYSDGSSYTGSFLNSKKHGQVGDLTLLICLTLPRLCSLHAQTRRSATTISHQLA